MARSSKIHLLNAQTVKNAKPREDGKQLKLNDGGGLRLVVQPNGAKLWQLRYTIFGKERTYSIGTYPDISLATARTEATKVRQQVQTGTDPQESKKEIQRQQQGDTFQDLAMQWFEKEKPRWSEYHAERVLLSLQTDILPQIGNLPISSITTQTCLAVIRKVESRGALDVASRIKQRMGACFRYGMAIGVCAINPVDPLDRVIQQKPVEHRKMIETAELPQFLRDIHESTKLHFVTRAALQMVVLTFVRSAELRGMKWSEIDYSTNQWRIPAERMKMKQEHIVPLSTQALAILEQIKPLTGNYDLVFIGLHDFRKPLSENTLTYAIRKRLGYDATAHGFRALASTVLNEQGWNVDAIERQLAHKESNAVRAAYNRSQYLAERTKMMQSWADYLDEQRNG